MKGPAVISLRAKVESVSWDPDGSRGVLAFKDETHTSFVVEVSEKFQARVHREGGELFLVISGSGLLYLAPAKFQGDLPDDVVWSTPVEFTKATLLVIPAGRAYCIVSTGNGNPLLMARLCPNAHLQEDRFLVNEPPDIEPVPA